jgi:hypothetical protein
MMSSLRRRGLPAGLALVGLASLAACRGEPYPDELRDAPTGCAYKNGVAQGVLGAMNLGEVSGMAVSRKNAGVFWVHNDSGDGTHIYAINSTGSLIGTFTLDGVDGADVEDMAIGPGPVANQDYLYLADIGDNDKLRPAVYIHRFPEPTVNATGTPVAGTLSQGNSFPLNYPNGERYNSETLMVDPRTGDAFIVTKDQGFEANEPVIFKMPSTAPVGIATTLTREGSLPLGSSALPTPDPFPTSGDVAFDGSRVILRTISSAFIWERNADESVAAAMKRAACSVPVAIEPQGEAIAFDAKGDYLTVSEGLGATIYRYSR